MILQCVNSRELAKTNQKILKTNKNIVIFGIGYLIKVGQVWEYRRVLSKNSKKYKQNSLLFSTDENVILIVGTNKLYFLYYLLDTEYDSPGNRVKIRNGDIDMLL